jgi:asparagine synthase (glutamine-hydrolysing)
MCGITGFYDCTSNLGAGDYQNSLISMTKVIGHRGPDASGLWIDPNLGIGLGHTRLSILDLSDLGSQPMISPSGRYIVVFNGEIYNHLDIRKNLNVECGQIAWRGSADTETLCALIDRYGIEDAVKKCVGMFAIGIWDVSINKLTLIRDRVGEKPLYYGWQHALGGSTFLFGSELKALKAHPNFQRKINRNALPNYLRFGYFSGEDTVYDGIFKLPPGCLLTLSIASKEMDIKAYWDARGAVERGVHQPLPGSPKLIVDQLEMLLESSVRSQMVADVPVGAFLSGGVDSSLITALMQKHSNKKIRTFSIGFNEEEYNEAPYAKKVAEALGTDHIELYLNEQDTLNIIPKISSIYDEPFADSSQIPTVLLCKLAREEVVVALSGDGADELFGGYNRYLLSSVLWNSLSQIPYGVRKILAKLIQVLPPHSWNLLMGDSAFLKKWMGSGERLHKGAISLCATSISDLYRRQVSQFYHPELIVKYSDPHKIDYKFNLDLFNSIGSVNAMMANDMLHYLPGDILTKVDRASMSVGLESRMPFLDYRVVEFAWAIPGELKIRKTKDGIITKWALREILYKYVPRHLIERPKAGFGVPIGVWLRGPLREWAENLLDQNEIERQGYFHSAPIRRLWREHLSGRFNRQHQLWVILMFQQWLSEQNG